MKISWHTDYDPATGQRIPGPVWPEGWPVPRVGDGVTTSDRRNLQVTAVDWFPHGEEDGDEPFVYVVLH